MSDGGSIGLIAGSGRLPFLFADAARRRGMTVHAVAHRGDADPALAAEVTSLSWVRLGQLGKTARLLRRSGVTRAVMAGGIGRVRALTAVRPDLGALRVVSRLRSFRDDAILRAVAAFFEEEGIDIVAPTEYLKESLASSGRIAGPAPTAEQERDVALGFEVARALGEVDVGQTVVVKRGNVLALEAVEGTDETIRRGARLGGDGCVVVKRCKPRQDERFDLPAIGPGTIAVMVESGAAVLAVEAGRSLLLDAGELVAAAEKGRVCLLGVAPQA